MLSEEYVANDDIRRNATAGRDLSQLCLWFNGYARMKLIFRNPDFIEFNTFEEL